MDIFNVLTMIGGLCLFLFGMNLMGDALERRAGSSLRVLLGKLTTNRMLGFLTGLAVTGVIQSSSATTVMVVGFVNSGLLTLGQAINVIMGANVGTTVTAWILSLSGIESGNVFVRLLKPSSFTPILALVGIVYYMFMKDGKKKDTGMIFLGFATLMFGMETMSGAVSSLKNVPEFQQMFLMFTNPILGVLVGAVLTGIIQSSSASVGILQALSSTGSVTYAAALQNYTSELAQAVREGESKTDHYEDILGTYLVKLSALKISENDSSEAAMLLKALSDFERIGDHALNLVESAEELKSKNLALSDAARHELNVLLRAVEEIVDMTFQAFRDDDLEKAYRVEPLEQVIDDLKEKMRIHHILRMQQGSCSIESGFVWSDLLTALERVGDHCSNIAGCVIDLHHHNMNTHEAIRSARMENENFDDEYRAYAVKYSLK